MNVPMKSATGYSTMPIECNLMIKHRIIFIVDEITQEVAVDVCKGLLFLATEDSNLPVNMVINSYGGSVDAGLMILDAMQGSGLEIHTWCLSRAFSMAALLFSAGKKRYMFQHAELMIHQPLVSASRIEGNVSMIKAVSDSLISTSKVINEILSNHTGRSEEEIENATRTDTYFTVSEAISFGLADEIAEMKDLIRRDCRK